MKSALLLFTLLFLVFCKGYAVSDGPTIESYKKINQAELAICAKNYKKACQYYKEAFELRAGYMDNTSACNYLYACALSGDTILLKQITAFVKKRGYEKEAFTYRTSFLPPKAKLFLLELWNQLPASTRIASSTELFIDSLIEIDQSENKRIREANHGLIQGLDLDSYSRLNYKNAVALDSVLKTKFLSDTEYESFYNPLIDPYWVLIRHNTQSKIEYIGIYSTLFSAVEKGLLPPSRFEAYFAMRSFEDFPDSEAKVNTIVIKRRLSPYYLIKYKDSLFYYTMPSANEIERVNEERSKIPGLCSATELYTKILVQNEQNIFKFIYDPYIFNVGSQMPAEMKVGLLPIKQATK